MRQGADIVSAPTRTVRRVPMVGQLGCLNRHTAGCRRRLGAARQKRRQVPLTVKPQDLNVGELRLQSGDVDSCS